MKRRLSFTGFSNYVTLKFISNYSDQKICNIPDCFACNKKLNLLINHSIYSDLITCNLSLLFFLVFYVLSCPCYIIHVL